MTEKAAQAYRNIREASELLSLEPHVLRFWESKFDQLSPMTRGGGRRFYSPNDISLLTMIRELLHVRGMTIKAAQRLLDQHGDRALDHAPTLVRNDDLDRRTESPKSSPAHAQSKSTIDVKAIDEIRAVLASLTARAQADIRHYDEMLNRL